MDRRLIQTAVFGSPDSDEPALCPEDAKELDAFLLEHESSFWCGTNLEGGCGRRLMTKRCTDKVCHFAHYPDSADERRCGRRNNGRDGANHLYVKAAFANWLYGQGISAAFEYPEPIGSAVEIRVSDGRVILVCLDEARPVPWDDERVWEIVLGPGVQVARDILHRRGYVHRIRFEDQLGSRRLLRYGTQTPGTSPNWSSLDEIVLADGGLTSAEIPAVVTPSITERMVPAILRRREIVSVSPSPAREVSARNEPNPAQQALSQLDGTCSGSDPRQVATAMRAVQELIEESRSEDTSRTLQAGLARGRLWLEQRAGRRRAVIAQVQAQFAAGRPVAVALTQAEELVQDDEASQEQKTTVRDLRARHAQQVAERREAEQRKAAQQRAEVEQATREREEEESRQARLKKVGPLVLCVRGALKKAASNGRTATWADLKVRTGESRLSGLSHLEKIDLLVMVERGTKQQDPLLSALLAVGGDSAARHVYREVAKQLGRSMPVSEGELLAQLISERDELHHQQL
jgi:hypothetical protein